MKQLLNKATKGNFSIQLTSDSQMLAKGLTTTYTVSRLHNTRVESCGDLIKHYKGLKSAQRKYERLTR